jgi:hypothetical protein
VVRLGLKQSKLGNGPHIFFDTITSVYTLHSKTGGFSFLWRHMQIFLTSKCNMLIFFTAETFCYGDVLFRRRFVTGDVLLRRRFVTETFCMETFCRGDVLCRDVLYVRHLVHVCNYLNR